ncbi:MAG: type III-A CRISPR-associated protein Csm2 [Polyangiaceae bacterium]|nr:type III-A CRISPR-associated protein Csm2 [Polyangiaceae bacterium]
MNGNDRGHPDHRGGRPNAQRQGGERSTPQKEKIDTSWVRKVIEEDDYAKLVDEAEKLTRDLEGDLMTQVRSIFTAVKQIGYLEKSERERAILMLRPRLRYAESRAKPAKRWTTVLTPIVEVMVVAVTCAAEKPEERTQRLIDLMEAIFCHVAIRQSQKSSQERASS